MRKVVILNAPANAGKDAIAEAFCMQSGVHHKEFKKPLFDIAKAVAQVSDETWDALYTREFKEQPSEHLFGRSPRDHMIHCSEVLIKPVYGEDYFGKVLASSFREGVNIVSDGGFWEEMQVVMKEVGYENVTVIRIHREGCSFENDSRDYVYHTGAKEFDINNDGTLRDLFVKVVNVVEEL